MRKVVFYIFLFFSIAQVSAQLRFSAVFNRSNISQPQTALHNIYFINAAQSGSATQSGSNHKTPMWAEVGYVLAMETFFVGMGYLASRKSKWGPTTVGVIDLAFVLAGVGNALAQELPMHQAGYYLLSAGFLAKALYNLKFNSMHQARGRFWTNYIGFNLLVFSGYYLDSLN